MTGGIYTIRVEDSDKFYIGRTKKFTTRKAHHLWLLRKNKHHCKYLQNYFNKYGCIKFIEEQEENDKQKRIHLEQVWLDKYKDSGLLFNHHVKASYDDQGDKPWDKNKKRIAHNKGKPSLFKGIKRDPQIAKKISETKKLKGQTEKQLNGLEENRKKIDRKKPRKPMSESAKKHLSEIQIGIKRKPYSRTHGLSISKARLGMKFTEEHKANLKKAAQNRIKKRGHQND